MSHSDRMKVVALLLCGLAVAAASDQWEDFKTTYGKSYVNLKEEQYRRSVHQQNQKYIDEHNERFQQGLVSFNLAMNQLGDMTQEEITATMTGYKSNVERKVSQVFNYVPGKSVAAAVDWRDKGAVTPVKDQGQCGSCWAFSATGVLEGQHFLKEGELVSLSEQNLVDCSWNHFNFGCEGGRSDWALGYIRDNGGIDTEESYPYEAKDATCRYDAENIGATCTGHTAIEAESETALEQAVNDIGPISVAIDASKLSFSFYSSGVYYEPDCSSTMLDHAVLAVGYGEEGGEEYWLVKNSWAESWGDSGYIKMAKNRDNNCGIATDACYPTL